MATKNWIAGAIKKPGALREALGAKGGDYPRRETGCGSKEAGENGPASTTCPDTEKAE